MTAVTVVIAVICSGCSDKNEDVIERPTGCVIDRGCPSATRCFEGVCAGGDVPAWPVRLRIRPQSDSPLATVEVDEILYLGANAVRVDAPIQVPRQVPLTVRIETANGARVAGQLSASPDRGISIDAINTVTAATRTDSGPAFLMAVAPWWPTFDLGGTRAVLYSMQLSNGVVPASDECPPESDCSGTPVPPWRFLRVGVAGTPPTYHGELPSLEPAELVFVTGQALLAADRPTPFAGVTIAVFDEAGRRVSTTATTDENGRFGVQLWPSEEPRVLFLRGSRNDVEKPLPTQVVTLEVAEGPGSQTSPLYFGDLPTTFLATGLIGTAEAPVEGAVVRLSTEVGGGRFSTVARTDSEGHFAVRVYPGEYTVDVEPPVGGSTLSRLSRRVVTLEADTAEIRIAPLPRTRVDGRVTDPDGAPVPNAAVGATLSVARYGDPALLRADETAPARQIITTTDDAGRFTLNLDRGDHALTIVPEPGAGLPSLGLPLTVSGEAPVVLDEARLSVPRAAAVTVILVDEMDVPVANALVEAWRDGDVPVKLAERVTDENGQVTLALPNPEEPPANGSPANEASGR